jgi:hypothetical protein
LKGDEDVFVELGTLSLAVLSSDGSWHNLWQEMEVAKRMVIWRCRGYEINTSTVL